MTTSADSPTLSYRLPDPRPPDTDPVQEQLNQLLRHGPADGASLPDFAASLITLQLDGDDFEILTPNRLLSNRDDPEYQLALDHLTVRVGGQGSWLVDADIIVRETQVGYPVAVIWVNECLDDDAERIAYWASKFHVETAQDLRVSVLTLDRPSPRATAERERKEALVLNAVDKVYWIGQGHPTDHRLTRLADLPTDIRHARNSVLHL